MPIVVAGLPASKGAHAKHSTRYANLCMFQVSEPHAASTLEPSQLAAQMGPNTGRLILSALAPTQQAPRGPKQQQQNSGTVYVRVRRHA